MIKKVGRNDHCPCGSGKKYKKCHLNSTIEVQPSNQPEIINSHMVSRDGKTWEKRPGLLAARIHVSDPKNIDKEVEELFKAAFSKKIISKNQDAEKKLHDCKHKIYAVLYHKKQLINEINRAIDDFKENYSATSGVQTVRENPILIYETEAFLFQVKSCLDILVQFLKFFIPSLKDFRTFKKRGNIAGGLVIETLRNNDKSDIADIFEQNCQKWIQELVDMRDTITHYSSLKGFNCFIEDPYLGGEVRIHYPSMPNEIPVDKYCETVFEELLLLFRQIFKLLN